MLNGSSGPLRRVATVTITKPSWHRQASIGITPKSAAEVRGGYLATITSAQENTFVHNLITANEYWINVGVDSRGPWLGGYQPAGSLEPAGGWTWVTGEAFVYQNWGISAFTGSANSQKTILLAKTICTILAAEIITMLLHGTTFCLMADLAGSLWNTFPNLSTAALLGMAFGACLIRRRSR